MLIHDQQQDGALFAFRFAGVCFTRRRILAIVKAIPRVRIIHEHPGGSAKGDVCEFDIDEARFVIRPGANGRFWVGPKRETPLPEIAVVRGAFEDAVHRRKTWSLSAVPFLGALCLFGAPVLWGHTGFLVLGMIAGAYAAAAYAVSPWQCGRCGGTSFLRAQGARERCPRCAVSRSP